MIEGTQAITTTCEYSRRRTLLEFDRLINNWHRVITPGAKRGSGGYQLLEHPLCKYCAERGIVEPATNLRSTSSHIAATSTNSGLALSGRSASHVTIARSGSSRRASPENTLGDGIIQALMNLRRAARLAAAKACEPGPLLVPAVLTLFKKAFWDQRRDM